MNPDSSSPLFMELVQEFDLQTHGDAGERVAGSLNRGLALLRDALFARLHYDFEKIVGKDSMLMPLSVLRTRQASYVEITLFQIAESCEAAKSGRFLDLDANWYLHWLARLRLGEARIEENQLARLTAYASQPPRERQLAFTNVLARVLPESRQAPLILFGLVPLAVRIATATALGDSTGASEMRQRQRELHPAIADCRSCHGRVLENGEQCSMCGNPLWKHDWLVAV